MTAARPAPGAGLDDLDRRLLDLLATDGRAPVAGLAKRLEVARSTVQQRLLRLEASGVIAGYTVRLGVPADEGITAYVHLTVDPKFGTRTADELAVIAEIRELHAVSGAFDLLAVVRGPAPAAIDAVLDRITRIPGVVRTSSSIVLSTKVLRPPGPGV